MYWHALHRSTNVRVVNVLYTLISLFLLSSEVLVDETDHVNDLHNNEGGKEEERENDTITGSAALTNEDDDDKKQEEAMSEKDDNEQLEPITPDVSTS